jgi:hypothetical protein
MPKLTPNIPYEDLGNYCQLAEYHAAWVMESIKSGEYLALSDFRPEKCGSTVVRQASYNDIQALANGLPILPQRSYQIGTEQGLVVLKAVMIDRRYHWVVTLEPPVVHKINNPPVQTTKRFTSYTDTDRLEVRSTPTKVKLPSRPAIHSQRPDYRHH